MIRQYGEPRGIHCSTCHGTHIEGTSYICSPRLSDRECEICRVKEQEARNDQHYNYCPHCGHKL